MSFLLGQRQSGKMKTYKYTWIELDLNKRSDDFRPESYSPQNYDFKDLQLHNHIDTSSNWRLRKELCLKNVYTDLQQLIEESNAPTNKSLATFKPKTIKGLVCGNLSSDQCFLKYFLTDQGATTAV